MDQHWLAMVPRPSAMLSQAQLWDFLRVFADLWLGIRVRKFPNMRNFVTTPLRPPARSRRSDLRYVFNDVISDASYAGVCDAWLNSWAGATAFVE